MPGPSREAGAEARPGLRRGRAVASPQLGRAAAEAVRRPGAMIGTVLCYVLLPAARLLRALRGNAAPGGRAGGGVGEAPGAPRSRPAVSGPAPGARGGCGGAGGGLLGSLPGPQPPCWAWPGSTEVLLAPGCDCSERRLQGNLSEKAMWRRRELLVCSREQCLCVIRSKRSVRHLRWPYR